MNLLQISGFLAVILFSFSDLTGSQFNFNRRKKVRKGSCSLGSLRGRASHFGGNFGSGAQDREIPNLQAGGDTGRAGQGLPLLHSSCSAATEILGSPKQKANILASGLQQEANPCEVMGCVAHRRSCLGEFQGFPTTSQPLQVLASSSAFKLLSRAEVSLSLPFCHDLQLVYLIKHCKSCREAPWRLSITLIAAAAAALALHSWSLLGDPGLREP